MILLHHSSIISSYMQQGIDSLEPSDPEWDLPDTFNATFDAWFRQMGYPIITVSTSADGSSTLLSQQRFLRLGTEEDLDYPESTLGYKWNTPIFYINGDNEYKMDWIRDSEDFTLELKGKPGIENWFDPEANAFVVFNYGGYSEFQNVSTVDRYVWSRCEPAVRTTKKDGLGSQ